MFSARLREYPCVLRTAVLGGVHDKRSGIPRNTSQPARHDRHPVARGEHERPQIDVALDEPAAYHGWVQRQSDGPLRDVLGAGTRSAQGRLDASHISRRSVCTHDHTSAAMAVTGFDDVSAQIGQHLLEGDRVV